MRFFHGVYAALALGLVLGAAGCAGTGSGSAKTTDAAGATTAPYVAPTNYPPGYSGNTAAAPYSGGPTTSSYKGPITIPSAGPAPDGNNAGGGNAVGATTIGDIDAASQVVPQLLLLFILVLLF